MPPHPAPAGQAGTPPVPERRTTVRFPCRGQASCYSLTAPPKKHWSATVLDLSTRGARLRINACLQAGALLEVTLHNESLRCSCPALLRVVQTRRDPADPSRNTWLLGCVFSHPLGR